MSADVDLSARARSAAEVCDACGRTAPRAEMIVDADPDTESGWLCAEGFGCLVRHAPVLRVAGIAVTPEVLAAAPSETSAAHAEAAASAVRSAARKAKASRGFSALADAELLVGGSAHVAPADLTLARAGAVRAALRRVVARLGRIAVEVIATSQNPAAVENAAVDLGASSAVLARWMRDMKAVRR